MRRRRRGLVLIVVLVTAALLSLAGYGFTNWMRSENSAVLNGGRTLQARMFAESGVEAAKLMLLATPETQQLLGGLYNNPGRFQGFAITVSENARDLGRFTLLAPAYDEQGYATGVMRYGLENESTRINLNVLLLADETLPGAAREILLMLPGMTEDVADAILDWIDEDDDPREYGAEVEYYSSLQPPYAPTNGPLESIEDLLSVRGVTPWLLLGQDAARTHGARMVSPEAASSGSGAASATSAQTATANYAAYDALPPGGWSSWLTIYSAEKSLAPDGSDLIDLNDEDLEALYDELSGGTNGIGVTGDQAIFIIAYRQFGPYDPNAAQENGGGQGGEQPEGGNQGGGAPQGGGQQGGGTEQAPETPEEGETISLGGAGGAGPVASSAAAPPGGAAPVDDDPNSGETPDGRELDLTRPGQTSLTSLLDLVGVRVQAQFKDEDEPVVLKAAFPDDAISIAGYLPKLAPFVKASGADVIPGRVNINQAPLAVLQAVPAMPEGVAEEIVSARVNEPLIDDVEYQHDFWPLAQGLVTLDEMRQILPFVTVGGNVYRVHAVGFFDEGPGHARIEAVIDATETTPRVVFWRELTHLGRGYPLSTLGSATALNGQP